MRIFSLTDAEYYCRSFIPLAGDSERSIKTFFTTRITSIRPRITIFREGTALFNEYRACSLRNVERNLFLSVSNYRRCLDLMTWALVTSYYGSFFAAQALLAMFGCRKFSSHVIDVNVSRSGTQAHTVKQIGSNPGQEPSTFTGSHQKFWDFFYRAFSSMTALVPSHLSVALTPVSTQIDWQPHQRNNINYDSYNAIGLTNSFSTSYNSARFPTSLPGVLNTQYRIFEATLELSFYYAKLFGFRTDALSNMGSASLKRNIKDNVYHFPLPKLVSKTKKNLLMKGLR